MKINWDDHIGKTLYVTMQENYGLAYDTGANAPIYEIVFKTGRLTNVYDDGLLLEQEREKIEQNDESVNRKDFIKVKIFIPHTSVKCVEIFEI